jgi:hypothetical protein
MGKPMWRYFGRIRLNGFSVPYGSNWKMKSVNKMPDLRITFPKCESESENESGNENESEIERGREYFAHPHANVSQTVK